jgi:hypothetical protein
LHVSGNGDPATRIVSVAALSSAMVIPPLVAVNGPWVWRGSPVAGNESATPKLGTGLGIVTLKLSGPTLVVAGVAPVASIWAVADPANVGETAAAAVAREAGRFATVW